MKFEFHFSKAPEMALSPERNDTSCTKQPGRQSRCPLHSLRSRVGVAFPAFGFVLTSIVLQRWRAINISSMKTEKLTKADLTGFTGTEQWYRHPVIKSTLYTDGIKYLAERAGAYWLVDEIAYQQYHPRVQTEEFQVWKLCVNQQQSSATLTCDDGNGGILFTKQIGYTDFPLEEIIIYFTNNVILLPGEY